MSKQALSYLLNEFAPSNISIAGDSRDYRKQFLDKNKQIFELGTAQYIASELKTQIELSQPSLLTDNIISSNNIQRAAEILRATFLSRVKSDSIVDESAGIVTYNSYDAMAKNLAKANKAAYESLEQVVIARGGSLGSLSSSLTSPDHSRTNAEVRFSNVFYNKLDDPIKALRSLRDFGGLSENNYDSFLTQYNEITSYYVNNEKVFDLTIGAELKLKSQKGNEAAGNKITKELIKAVTVAVNKAIINKNWVDQEGSDSYRTALEKELNNIAVKQGATGKLQSVDKAKNTIKSSTRVPVSVSKYKPGVPAKLEAAEPLISLQNIVNYINGRLPEAVRANMGPGTLVNRTGTFANSAKITDAKLTPEGFPSIGYTYQRSPYDVFDPTLGKKPWNTPSRDPSKLIQKSVRDIARDMAIGRFYLRRA